MENKLAVAIIVAIAALLLLGALAGSPLAGLLGGGYLFAVAVGALLLAFLFWAPMKLYSIDRTLKRMEENQHTQTKLLASIANDAADSRRGTPHGA